MQDDNLELAEDVSSDMHSLTSVYTCVPYKTETELYRKWRT